MVSPSALAISSNLVDCSTGMSAGFPPRSILLIKLGGAQKGPDFALYPRWLHIVESRAPSAKFFIVLRKFLWLHQPATDRVIAVGFSTEGLLMRSLIISSVSALMLTWTGAANAASSQLKGEYGFTGFSSCQFSGLPFTTDGVVYQPSPLPTVPDGVFFNLFNVQGIRTFDGNGNGTVKARSVNITPRPSLNPNIGTQDVEFAFTYTIDASGGFETSWCRVPIKRGRSTSTVIARLRHPRSTNLSSSG